MTDVIRHHHRNIRDQVHNIESVMKNMPQAELTVKHYFVPGVYIRELYIPKDAVLVGKIHKYDQYHFLQKGKLRVLIDDEIQEITAPSTLFSKAGAKRIAWALEDTVWIMVHGTNETDLGKIEDHFIAKSETEWLEFCKQEPELPLLDKQQCLTI